MNTPEESKTWLQAFITPPGPSSTKEYINLFVKGLCMGVADIIPGVSGGTIALISGIYQDLLSALQSLGTQTITHLLKLDFKSALATIHLRFLLTLFSGIIPAIIIISRVINYLLHKHSTLTWSLFFGLIAASILMLGKGIKQWYGGSGISFLIGAVGTFYLVGLIPMTTPNQWWFIILVGVIAICAMILPGISGAFILLLLSKYEFMTAALKDPFDLRNIVIISLFCSGAFLGLIGFSRVLSYCLKRYEQVTMAMLTGFLLGSLRKIWPWKQVLETKMIRGKPHVIAEINILPNGLDLEFITSIILMAAGFLIILLLEKKSRS